MKLRTTNPNVVVCSASRAEKHMRNTYHSDGKPVAGLISIASPAGVTTSRSRPGATVSRAAARRLFLTFEDEIAPSAWDPLRERWEPASPPTMEDVQKILNFGRGLPHFQTTDPQPDRVIIHCYAGHSRSTAAALMLFLQGMPNASDTDIIGALTSSCEEAKISPNSLMVKLADQALGANGRLRDLEAYLYSSQATMYG